MDEPAYERALHIAMRLVLLIDVGPDIPPHVLLSKFIFEILEVIRG
jgi:hypothetical protein